MAGNLARTVRARNLDSVSALAGQVGAQLDPYPAGDLRAGQEVVCVGTSAAGRAIPALLIHYGRPGCQPPIMVIVQPGQYVKLLLTAETKLEGYDAFEETPEGYIQDRTFSGGALEPVLAELDRLAVPPHAARARVREHGIELELACSVCGLRAAAFRWGARALDASRSLASAALSGRQAPVDDHLVYFDQQGDQQWTFGASASEQMAQLLRTGRLDELHGYLHTEVPFRPELDAYCAACDAVYCARCCTRTGTGVTCRAGHARALN